MTTVPNSQRQNGFSLLELLVAMAFFLTVCGAMFRLLNADQQRYQTDSQVLSSFQQARLGLDEIVRDVSDAGYPPLNHFSATAPANIYAFSPIAWSPSYPNTSCVIGACASPTGFDVILEGADYSTGTVQWTRYQLVGTTLYRGVVNKVVGADPAASFGGAMVPYVYNVVNNASGAEIATYRLSYPAMFPGGNPQPIFQYYCDNLPGPPALCQYTGSNDSPANVREIEVTLIVQTEQVDAQTHAPRLVELNGNGQRVNPNQ